MVWIYTDAEEWVDISEEELEWLNLKWPIISAGKDVEQPASYILVVKI